MARYLTSSQLIESAKRKAMIPATQVTFTDDDFLAFATEEMDVAVMPYVLSFHEDYFLFPEDIPLVRNQNKYPIPYRAVGNKLRDIAYLDPAQNLYEMTRIMVEDIPYYQNEGNTASNSPLRAFHIRNNEIVLTPEIGFQVEGYIRAYYYIRPSRLVSESRAMTVLNMDLTAGKITVDTLPSIFTIGTVIDFNQRQSPHKCLAIDVTITDIDSINKVITFDPATIPQNLSTGDNICLAEECIIPQIPTDLHSLLAQRIACRCLEALGDTQGLQAANAKLSEMELKLGAVIQDRVEGAPLKILNRHSFLRHSRRYFRR